MKKIMIPCGFVLGITVTLLAILLALNPDEPQKLLSGLTPEETAIRHAKGMTVAGYQIDPNTVEAIQQVELNDMVLVLVQYYGHRNGGGAELCEMLLEVEKKQLNQWKAKGGAGLCHELNDSSSTIPMTVASSYGTTKLLERGYSTAFGYLRNEQITKIVVTWDDGLSQPASVSARTYLTAREGSFHVEKIEAFNHLDEIVYTSQAKSNP